VHARDLLLHVIAVCVLMFAGLEKELERRNLAKPLKRKIAQKKKRDDDKRKAKADRQGKPASRVPTHPTQPALPARHSIILVPHVSTRRSLSLRIHSQHHTSQPSSSHNTFCEFFCSTRQANVDTDD
jgi:hypothetical protein